MPTPNADCPRRNISTHLRPRNDHPTRWTGGSIPWCFADPLLQSCETGSGFESHVPWPAAGGPQPAAGRADPSLGQHIVDDVGLFDTGQLLIQSQEGKRQSLVIDSEQV